MKHAPVITGFPPIASANAKILILGSMPSETSLRKQQYYAHPRNAFWKIIREILAFDDRLVYGQKKEILGQHGVAVWDVLKQCIRPGSMDADIHTDSVQVNEFVRFFKIHRLIRAVFFNGRTAELLYQKYVLPEVVIDFPGLNYQRLPSTSPAYASMTLAGKLAAWKAIEHYLDRDG